MQIWRVAAWAFLFFMSCKFQASCGNNDNLLNTPKGERVIAEWLDKQGMPADAITCPRDIKMVKDANFVCQATIAESDGLVIDILVEQTNDKGDIHLEHGSKVQPAENVERGLAGQILDQTGEKVEVDCGLRARLPVVGKNFRCKVRGEAENFTMEIRFEDGEGAWQARRI